MEELANYIERLLEKGADKVSINTSAILDPSLVGNAAKKFGSQCIVVAVDSKREGENLMFTLTEEKIRLLSRHQPG